MRTSYLLFRRRRDAGRRRLRDICSDAEEPVEHRCRQHGTAEKRERCRHLRASGVSSQRERTHLVMQKRDPFRELLGVGYRCREKNIMNIVRQ